MPVVMLFGCFTLLCAWSLTSLLLFHAMIITVAQTTNERVRNVYQLGRNQNVDDHGCCSNWKHAFCSQRPESQLPADFTDMVVCDHRNPETVWKNDNKQATVNDQEEAEKRDDETNGDTINDNTVV